MVTTNGCMVLDDLSEPSRRLILDQLRTGEKSVGMIVAETGMKQPNVSNHLARMRERGVVTAQRIGRQVFYRLTNPVVHALLDVAGSTPASPNADALTSEDLEVLSLRFYRAIADADESAASDVLNECIARRLKLETLYVDVVQEAMYRLGEWQERRVACEADEHIATAITERVMARALPYFPAHAPNGMTALLGSARGNQHTLGLRMIADVLQQRGWSTLFVGAGVSQASFLQLVRRKAPELVLVSCTTAELAEATGALVYALREQRRLDGRPFVVGLGGRHINACPRFAADAGADFTARDARSLVYIVDRMFS